MRHAACDFAKQMMQVALAQSGVWLSDGATNIMPIAPHRPRAGASLSDAQRRENRDVVYRAWKLHCDDVQHSLVNGFYDWTCTRALPTLRGRLRFYLSARQHRRNFSSKAAQATLVGDVK
jgi:hypothetical protein